MSGGGDVNAVLAGVEAARAAGFDRLKFNAVVLRNYNDRELADLAPIPNRTERDIRRIAQLKAAFGAEIIAVTPDGDPAEECRV